MTEYISDHGYQRPGRGAGWSAKPDRSASVAGDHLLIMHLLHVRGSGKAGGEGSRKGHASLDSLRELSGLPAWRVWELVDDLQELGLVSCIWDSRTLRTPSPASLSGGASGDLRFLRCTQAGLTETGHSYPPLLEYQRLRTQRRWESSGLAPGRTRQRQAQPRRRYLASKAAQWKRQPSRAYHLYRPQAQAARRLAYLACAFCAVILAAGIYLALALT